MRLYAIGDLHLHLQSVLKAPGQQPSLFYYFNMLKLTC